MIPESPSKLLRISTGSVTRYILTSDETVSIVSSKKGGTIEGVIIQLKMGSLDAYLQNGGIFLMVIGIGHTIKTWSMPFMDLPMPFYEKRLSLSFQFRLHHSHNTLLGYSLKSTSVHFSNFYHFFRK